MSALSADYNFIGIIGGELFQRSRALPFFAKAKTRPMVCLSRHQDFEIQRPFA